MPHCIIELTKNIANSEVYEELMEKIANVINVDGIFVSDDIKVRVIEIEHSFMGIRKQEHSYVAVEIVLINNKNEQQCKRILKSVQNVLNNSFKDIKQKFSITSRLTLVDSKNYIRKVNY